MEKEGNFMSKELNEEELDKIAGGKKPSPCPKNKIKVAIKPIN